MSQGGQLQPELNGGDMLFQHTSLIFGVWRPNSTCNSSTLISSIITTENELWCWKSEGISEEICPFGECNNYSYLQILLTLLFLVSSTFD